MNVESLMTPAPKTCTTTDTLHRAATLMWEVDCGIIPVVDAQNRLRGVLTDRDICMATYTQGKPPHEIRTEDVMSKLLFTLSPSDSITAAAQFFKERQVRRAPIVNGVGTLVGILSISDVVHASASGKLAQDIKPDAVLAVVHAVSKPRHTEKAAAPKIETRDVILSPAKSAATPAAKRTPASGKTARRK